MRWIITQTWPEPKNYGPFDTEARAMSWAVGYFPNDHDWAVQELIEPSEVTA